MMHKTAKVIGFVVVALLVLIVGCVGAQMLSGFTHLRYDAPNTGARYGMVDARFHRLTEEIMYHLEFRGETQPRWRWHYPTNFQYTRLQVDWDGKSSGSAFVSLPSLRYESSNSTGVLTRALLAEWLLGDTNYNRAAKAEVPSVSAIFDYIEAAGSGTLPRAQHHPHSVKEPMQGMITHFCLGLGVSSFVYVWFAIWLLYFGVFARRYFAEQRKPNSSESARPDATAFT